MNFTDEQIEEAARILCEMRGKRPDDRNVMHCGLIWHS